MTDASPNAARATILGVLTPHGDGATVHFERTYATSAADLWSGITSPDRLKGWLGTLTGDLTVGGRYRIAMSDEPDSENNHTGEVLVCDEPRRLVVTWDFPGEGTSELEAIVAESGGGAALVLDHRGLNRAQARDYGAGWHTYLDDLGTALAGGTAQDWNGRFERVLPDYQAQLPKDEDPAEATPSPEEA
ncbi:MAG: SRPBCC family protein [Actinomycetales bacterium]|nr:SRPBCC family protein [Actinomycetales bacterium]